MSNLPFSDPYSIIEGSEFLSPLDDDSWSLNQEILQSAAEAAAAPPQIINHDEINEYVRTDETCNAAAHVHVHVQQLQNLATAGTTVLDSGLKLMKISCPNSKTRKKINSKSNINDEKSAAVVEHTAEEEKEEEGPSTAKKLNHNAKERIRRMKLNASYLALRALLPDSRRSKKRWSAPAIVDRVLKHIPELETEVEALRSKKENVQSSAAKNKKINIAHEDLSLQYQSDAVSVSVNKVCQEEAIIQMCMAREEGLTFIKLLQNVEDEGITIRTASTVYVSESRICYHLYILVIFKLIYFS